MKRHCEMLRLVVRSDQKDELWSKIEGYRERRLRDNPQCELHVLFGLHDEDFITILEITNALNPLAGLAKRNRERDRFMADIAHHLETEPWPTSWLDYEHGMAHVAKVFDGPVLLPAPVARSTGSGQA